MRDDDFADMIGNIVLDFASKRVIDGITYICPWTSKYKIESMFDYSLSHHFAPLFYKNATIEFDERGCVRKYSINSKLAKKNLVEAKKAFS